MGKRTNSLQYDIRGLQTLKAIPNPETKEQYEKIIKSTFAPHCREFLNINTMSKLEDYGFKKAIQSYADKMVEDGYAASTIHTRVAAICTALGVPMKEIEKPRRIASENVRSRKAEANTQGKKELQKPEFQRIISFQVVTGIRRHELKKLRGNNLVQDETGNWCIEVKKGKGGKYQLQRIDEANLEFIRGYFNGSNEKVFSADELNNKIDFHSMRADNAQKMYAVYLDKCKTEEGRFKLMSEMLTRYKQYNKMRKGESVEAYNKRYLKFKEDLSGTYFLRGVNRAFAEKHGLPISYDKTALMAVSVFHLSHWRLNVAISNYLLNVTR